MTDYISQQPDEILLLIFKYVGYYTDLASVSNRFKYITRIIDMKQIKQLQLALEDNNSYQIRLKSIYFINNYLMKTYILGPVYNCYNFNILDIADTLKEIELYKINKLIYYICDKHYINFNDCKKIINHIINNINTPNNIIIKQIYQIFYKLICMNYLLIENFSNIIKYIKSNISLTDLKIITIINLHPYDFLYINEKDYHSYQQYLINNIKQLSNSSKINLNNTIYDDNDNNINNNNDNDKLENNKKQLFYNMICNSDNFNKHIAILKSLYNNRNYL
jgi:hypothetical protein